MTERNSKAYVFGALGIIGRALADRLSRHGVRAIRVGRRAGCDESLDLATDVHTWRPKSPASVAYLCAAQAALDYCRTHPQESRLVNVDATRTLAEICLHEGMRVVFLSTNLVFDGQRPFQAAGAKYGPMTEYGRQKRDAEQALLALNGSVAVVRLTKVLHWDQRLIASWRDSCQRGTPIKPFSDMPLSPVGLGFVTQALDHIGQSKEQGIYQISGSEDITYEQAARRLAAAWGREHLIRPMTVAESGLTLEHVPTYTTLDASRIAAEFSMPAPSPSSVLDEIASA